MDIKPFVKRVFDNYKKGLKQPVFYHSIMVKGKAYNIFAFEVKRADMAEEFYNEMANAYEGKLPFDRLVRVEKDLRTDDRVLIGIYVPIEENGPLDSGQETQKDEALVS